MKRKVWAFGRRAWHLGVLLLASAAPATAFSQAYPVRPIRLLLPYPAGGSADLIARPLAPRLSERLGQQVVVDNRGGAGGNIAMELVAKAPADGYTLGLGMTPQLATNVSIYKDLPYDPLRDYAPISLLASAPYLLEVHPSVPVRTVSELIALAKQKPGQLNYWSSGSGSAPHLSMELLKSMTAIDLVHVPYKGGGPAFPDFLAGRVQVTFTTYGSTAEHLRAGRLRALAVSTAKRSRAMPELPTIAEAGVPGYESGVWYGLIAPRGTPRAIVQRLSSDAAAALNTSEVGERLGSIGVEIIGSSPEKFDAYIRSEILKWAAVVKRSGARID